MTSQIKTIPISLRKWFVVHFILDVVFAIPMFLFPVFLLSKLGWQQIDPITTRMVAAALFGIGIESLLCRKANYEVFKSMLNLKIIWSSASIIGLSIALITNLFGNIFYGLILLSIFVVFNIIWVFYRIKIK